MTPPRLLPSYLTARIAKKIQYKKEEMVITLKSFPKQACETCDSFWGNNERESLISK